MGKRLMLCVIVAVVAFLAAPLVVRTCFDYHFLTNYAPIGWPIPK